MLHIEAGKSKGKKVILKKNEYTIGSARKSNIRLRGEFVSPEHAVLKLRDENQWVLQNRSSNQTLVNNQVIDTKPLVVGDSIQVGASNLLKFDLVPVKSKKEKNASDGQSQFTNVVTSYLKKPAVIVGLTFYLILLLLVFSLLSNSSKDRISSDWSRASIDTVIESSSNYLLERSNFVAPPSDDGVLVESKLSADQISSAAKKLSGYDAIIWLHQNTFDQQDSPLPQMVDELMQELQEKLTQIWHLEQQGRWAEVVTDYEEALTMVPDINLPITQKIIERQRWALDKQEQ